jgi:hypothetical protein
LKTTIVEQQAAGRRYQFSFRWITTRHFSFTKLERSAILVHGMNTFIVLPKVSSKWKQDFDVSTCYVFEPDCLLHATVLTPASFWAAGPSRGGAWLAPQHPASRRIHKIAASPWVAEIFGRRSVDSCDVEGK